MSHCKRLVKALKGCETLAQADKKLEKAGFESLPVRWGIWDGWAGRPPSTDGLMVHEKGPEVIEQYREGYGIGKCLPRE